MTTRGEGNGEILPTTYILYNDLEFAHINKTKIKILALTQHSDAFNILFKRPVATYYINFLSH